MRTELLWSEYDFRQKDIYNSQKVKYLNSALQINDSDTLVIFKLAETYYKDFIYPLEKEKDWGFDFELSDDYVDSTFIKKEKIIKQSTFEHSADSALKFFYKLWAFSTTEIKENIYFSIRQLECYLKCRDESPIKEDIMLNSYCYFPPWYFANLSENWECDSTVDYLFDIKFSKDKGGWLIYLKEPCLYNRSMEENAVVFRFTWVRTFHNPICIRLEKNAQNTMLYWKVERGAGGYEPKGIKKTGKRKLTQNEWNKFMDFFNNTDFHNLPNEKYIPMCDGATWTLEYKTKDNFKAHRTNVSNGKFKECCLFLLKLTNIKVKEDDIY